MIAKDYIKKYEGKKFLFHCRKCSEDSRNKREFEVKDLQRIKGAVLRCCECGHLISRNVKLLDKQIKEGKK